MLESIIKKKPRNVLLLQGPTGNFFRILAEYLQEKYKSRVYKINYNLGDQFFYSNKENVYNYKDKLENLKEFYQKILTIQKIDTVFLFGDCRPIHRKAIEICKELNIDVYVFEEGYIRPNYITLEKGGVNGYSSMPHSIETFFDYKKIVQDSIQCGQGKFHYMAWNAFLYFSIGTLGKFLYPYYVHHKPFEIKEAFYWIRSYIKKPFYKIGDYFLKNQILNQKKPYFFVPLQVSRDSQVNYHSHYQSNDNFIKEIIHSFANYAHKDSLLVIKHHPLDRGHNNYSYLIQNLIQKYQLQNRIYYVHDVYLPKFLQNAKGTIVINSTVGLSSLFHGTPVKVMGKAFYNFEGMTSQQSLEDFWQNPTSVDKEIFFKYRNYLIDHSQIAGSFYHFKKKPLKQKYENTAYINLVDNARDYS